MQEFLERIVKEKDTLRQQNAIRTDQIRDLTKALDTANKLHVGSMATANTTIAELQHYVSSIASEASAAKGITIRRLYFD